MYPPPPRLVDNYYDPRDFDYDDWGTFSDEESLLTDSRDSDRDSPVSERRRRRRSRYRDRQHHDGTSHPKLTICRHKNKRSIDPTFQDPLTSFQPQRGNQSPFPKVHVTIRQNTAEPEPAVVQPLLYPVPVYMESPVVAYPNYQPIQMAMEPRVVAYPTYQSVQPVQMVVKPPAPVIVQTPVQTLAPALRVQALPLTPPPPDDQPPKKPPATSLSNFSDRYETESFVLPSTRNNPNAVRRRPPVRMDIPSMAPIEATLPKSPPTKSTRPPPKTISYRAVQEGLTTREMENKNAGKKGKVDTVRVVPDQNITYRDRARRHWTSTSTMVHACCIRSLLEREYTSSNRDDSLICVSFSHSSSALFIVNQWKKGRKDFWIQRNFRSEASGHTCSPSTTSSIQL